MKLTIDISENQAAKLTSEAEKLGIGPEALVKAAVVEMLERKDDFTAAADHVLSKNRELYQRLS